MTASGPKTSTRASAPTSKPVAPAPTIQPVAPEVEDQEAAPAGPTIERVSIGSLLVERTTYEDGDCELNEVKTLTKGPDEKFKSWRHAQSV
jgi:hypothetical protein